MWFVVFIMLVKLPPAQDGAIVPHVMLDYFGDRTECDNAEAKFLTSVWKKPDVVGYTTGKGCEFVKVPVKV